MYFDWRYIVGYSWYRKSLRRLSLSLRTDFADSRRGHSRRTQLSWNELSYSPVNLPFHRCRFLFEQLRFLTLVFFRYSLFLYFNFFISLFFLPLFFLFRYFFVFLIFFFLYFIYFFIYNEHTILKCTVKREESCTIKGYTKTHKIPIFCCFGSVLSMLSVSQILRTRKISTHIVLYRDLIFST